MSVVRRGGGVRAYVNACPHVRLPLDFRHREVLSGDGERLVSTSHFAEFSIEDGGAVAGPVKAGCRPTPVPVHVDAGGAPLVGAAPR